MSADENARRRQDAMQLMLGRNAEAFLVVHEGRAATERERASRARNPLLRWVHARRARSAERWAERCREEIRKAEQIEARSAAQDGPASRLDPSRTSSA
jgi:hypothetical protein